MSRFADDPDHWRDRAEEARAVAEMMKDPIARLAMLKISVGYEMLAIRAEERIGLRNPRVDND